MNRLEAGCLAPLGVGPSINTAFYQDVLVVIQTGAYPRLNPAHNGRLLVIDPSAAQEARVIGCLDNLGSARQITIAGDTAYVSSREDGLFLVNLKNPRQPTLLSHYETTEFATGVCVAQDLAVVSLRQYGLELIDVRDPKQPRFISLIRTGEAQSVWLDGHTVYAGVWGSKELVIADISAPESPEICARVPLDGRGDGVIVRDHICFAATGQHARPPKGMENPPPETYEQLGNGLEIFDVSDPAHPVRLSGVKFPPYYGLTFDMWSVQLSGDVALVSNTRNGLFFVDVSDLSAPHVIGRVQLPTGSDGRPDPIGGFAYRGDVLALAGGETDAYICRLSRALSPSPNAKIDVSPAAPRQALRLSVSLGKEMPWERVLDGLMVQAVAEDENRLFAACAEDGLLVLEKGTFRRLSRLPVSGAGRTHAAVFQRPFLYVAEGPDGLAVYLEGETGFVRQSVYSPYGRSVNDLQLSGDGKFLLIQCASLGVIQLSLEIPEKPRVIGEYLDFVGLFYGRHFPSSGYLSDCYLGSNRDGIFRIHGGSMGAVKESLPLAPGPYGFGPSCGLERIGDRLLAITGNGGFFLIPLEGSPAALPVRRTITGAMRCAGKPRIFGHLLVMTERAEGVITLCDASEPETLRAFYQAETTASPDLACMDRQYLYIPGGRQGLLVFRLQNEKE